LDRLMKCFTAVGLEGGTTSAATKGRKNMPSQGYCNRPISTTVRDTWTRVSDGCETATGVMEAATRRKGVRGIRWDNVVITLIRGWIWTDLTLFPSGSSIRMAVSSNTSEM
jgi:hypothetical protein